MKRAENEQDREKLFAQETTKKLPEICGRWVFQRSVPLLPSTQGEYLSILLIFYNYFRNAGQLPPPDRTRPEDFARITQIDLERFLTWQRSPEGAQRKKVSDNTISIRLSVLKMFFSYLTEGIYIKANPALEIQTEIRPIPSDSITDEDIKKFFHTLWIIDGKDIPSRQQTLHMQTRLRNMIMARMLFETEISIQEMVNLNVSDFNNNIRYENLQKDTYQLICMYLQINGYSSGSEGGRASYLPTETESAMFLSKKTHSRIAVRTVNSMINSYCNLALSNNKKITVKELQKASSRHIQLDPMFQ